MAKALQTSPPVENSPLSPLLAQGYTLVSSRQLSWTLHLDYILVNILISSSPDGLIPWLRLRHAWALASWGSIKRSDMVNWEKKTHKTHNHHICASDISYSSWKTEILPDVCVLCWLCINTFICICNLFQVSPMYFVTSSFGCPQCKAHHGLDKVPHHTGQILGQSIRSRLRFVQLN